MKHFFLILIMTFILVTISSCSNPSPSESTESTSTPSESSSVSDTSVSDTNEKSLKDIMDAILEGYEGLLFDTEITTENFTSYLFINPIEGAEGLATEAPFGASYCLLRLPEGEDAKAVSEKIEQNADPSKWICVTAEKVIVRRNGNLIFFVMASAEDADRTAANFDNLFK